MYFRLDGGGHEGCEPPGHHLKSKMFRWKLRGSVLQHYNRHSPSSRMLDEQYRMPLNSSYTCRVICCTPPSTIVTMDNCWNSSECGNRQWHNRLSQSDPINELNKGEPKMMRIFALINRTSLLSWEYIKTTYLLLIDILCGKPFATENNNRSAKTVDAWLI